MPDQFTWIEIYEELATVLANWQERQSELISFLEQLREEGYTVTSLSDKNRDGERFLVREIDPFTFFGVFNRGIKDSQRIAILARIKEHFQLKNPIPSDFVGIPILNNMASWFFRFQASREPDHVPRLWHVFQLALQSNPLENKQFLQAFDDAQSIPGININLTMGLFWIRPKIFLSLDRNNRDYLKINMPKGGINSQFYVDLLRDISKDNDYFPGLSFKAWQASQTTETKPDVQQVHNESQNGERAYWLVGAYWDDREPQDQTQRFLAEGIWVNGYTDRYLDEIKSMAVNDKIAIKAATTQRKNLPFDANDQTVSRMDIKAIGTIVANRNDGRTIEVEWDPDFQEKSWFFFTNRSTVWRLKTGEDYRHKEYSEKLINFTWGNSEQDYDWFVERWWGNETEKDEGQITALDTIATPYSIDDIMASGVFIEEDKLRLILDRLSSKKALILQGSPGVGKTFIARKLAYALMEEIDKSRLEMVQFHQSYSYDDFVRGYRPMPGQAGSFGLQNGVFFDFCEKAKQDPDNKYVFIVDEINRGNLSLIFGELLMLIEGDKRGEEFSVPLVYRIPDEPRFFIPSNLYLIGLMNIADRSLAMVDYALRRRFAFFTLQPQYGSPIFRDWLLNREMPLTIVDLIMTRMGDLNQEIRKDTLLGENYQVGHSYFCPKGDNFSELNQAWYESVVDTEIAPLLKEYWFDNPQKAKESIKKLLG